MLGLQGDRGGERHIPGALRRHDVEPDGGFTHVPVTEDQLPLVAGEIRELLAGLGARRLDEIIGRTDLLRPIDPDHPVASGLDALLVPMRSRYSAKSFRPIERSPLGEALTMVFSGSGECAEVVWRLMGLSMPSWVLV